MPEPVFDGLSDDELMSGVDGSTVERVIGELKNRGGEDARLGEFLKRAVCDYWAGVDPESCVNE